MTTGIVSSFDTSNRQYAADGTGAVEGLAPPGLPDALEDTAGLNDLRESDEGTDLCMPQCGDKECGPDGCGGKCGKCPYGGECIVGKCSCKPQCVGAICGDDGCGGSCGKCRSGQQCVDGICKCKPQCYEKQCGPDGCGDTCGACPCTACALDKLVCADDGLCEPEPGLTCEEVYDCVAACPYDDQGCYINCQISGSPFAQSAFTAFMTCLQNVGYADCASLPESQQTDCYLQKQALCEAEIVVCFHGDLTCADMWLCLIECPNGDGVCQDDCLLKGNVDAQYQWNDFVNCLNNHGYWDCPPDDSTCKSSAWKACEADFKACASGDKKCVAILDCLDSCAPWELVCQSGCIFIGSLEAQATYQAVVDCVVWNCGPSPSWECHDKAIVDQCSAEFVACLDN